MTIDIFVILAIIVVGFALGFIIWIIVERENKKRVTEKIAKEIYPILEFISKELITKNDRYSTDFIIKLLKDSSQFIKKMESNERSSLENIFEYIKDKHPETKNVISLILDK